jgi:hypothetical protein
MRARGHSLLLAGLVVVAALVLHELRYVIGYGHDAGRALSEQGHSYLSVADLGVVVLLGLGMTQLLVSLRRALHTATSADHAPFGVLWLASFAALLGIYAGQELLEGVLASGHPTGLAALAVNGGWSALPLAMALATVVALLLRGAAAVEALVARRGRARPRRPRAAVSVPVLPLLSRGPDGPPLARKLASRAPPLAAHPS